MWNDNWPEKDRSASNKNFPTLHRRSPQITQPGNELKPTQRVSDL